MEKIETYKETLEGLKKVMKKIVRERKKQGLSQKDFAEMAGLNQASLARTERGETTPSLIMLIKIADTLNLSFNELTKGNIVKLKNDLVD